MKNAKDGRRSRSQECGPRLAKAPEPEHDSAALLKERIADLRRRKGAFSTIVKTLEAALASGTPDDLRRGHVAFEMFEQDGEQRHFKDIPSAKPKLPPSSVPTDRRVLAQALESKLASKKRFSEDFSSLSSEGIDFSKPDRLSTSKKRLLLAKRKRRLRLTPGRK